MLGNKLPIARLVERANLLETYPRSRAEPDRGVGRDQSGPAPGHVRDRVEDEPRHGVNSAREHVLQRVDPVEVVWQGQLEDAAS